MLIDISRVVRCGDYNITKHGEIPEESHENVGGRWLLIDISRVSDASITKK